MTDKYDICPETKEDAPFIKILLIEAFRHMEHSLQNEADIIEKLRKEQSLSCAFVAKINKKITGYIAFSPVRIQEQDGWHGLGPLAILPEYQRQGIGKQLVHAGLTYMRQHGNSQGCIVLGDPAYYRKFGFRPYKNLFLKDVPPEYLLALPFLNISPAGEVCYHPAFYLPAGTHH